jgi:predicted TIM-barrel fold metal-dependent hydrolase
MELQAIDVHTHIATREALGETAAMAAYFRTELRPLPIEETAALYRSLNMRAVIFGVDRETSGEPYVGNAYVAQLVATAPDVLIGFASVDPWKGDAAVAEVRSAVRDHGLAGVKFMPITQRFYPDDERFYPLWEEIASLGVPAVFHVGHTGVGAGTPGGGGWRLEYGRPIPHLDRVAADFPTLTLVAAHPGWPWHDELLSMMLHKSNVWMDLSGWSPRYLPPSVVQYANTLLQDRVLFGTDYPLITPQRWLADFATVAFKDSVRPKILLDNARRLLQLS